MTGADLMDARHQHRAIAANGGARPVADPAAVIGRVGACRHARAAASPRTGVRR